MKIVSFTKTGNPRVVSIGEDKIDNSSESYVRYTYIPKPDQEWGPAFALRKCKGTNYKGYYISKGRITKIILTHVGILEMGMITILLDSFLLHMSFV